MSGEIRHGQDFENVAEHYLAHELLSWAVEKERVVELPDFTFLGPYSAFSSLKDRVKITRLPLGAQGILAINPSESPDSSHTLSITGFVDGSVGKVFMAGFPYQDTSEADREIAEVESQELSEWNDRFRERSDFDSDDRPPSGLSWPFRLFPQYGESIEDFDKRRDQHNREWNAYNERQERRDKERQREDEREEARYQRIKDSIASSHTPVIRHKVAFFGGRKNENGENIASVDFNVQMESSSIFIPYQPIDWEAFNDKLFLKLFLSYIDQDKGNLENWINLFNGRLEGLGIMPRLAIMAKIQALGGVVE